jgi:GNAT superfamily N-acetyltransferase
MAAVRLHLRRCRRTDFVEVMRLLSNDASPAPIPDRRTLRRFRGIVNDLGGDLYVALVDDRLVGLVHVTYTRQLTLTPRAQLDRLIVDPEHRSHGVGSALFELALRRAIGRGCGTLQCSAPPAEGPAARFLTRVGMRPEGRMFVTELNAGRAPEAGAGS